MLQSQAQWLDDPSLFANLITVFNAGFVTTTQLFGHTVALLLRRPGAAWPRMRADPALVAPYVEEILRFEPPVHFVIRVSTVDSEVQGVEIPAGSRVLVLIGAANRDPVRFPRPDEFDPAPAGQPADRLRCRRPLLPGRRADPGRGGAGHPDAARPFPRD